jgi:hypothetical protein
MVYLFRQRLGIGHREFEMLRCDVVGHRHRIIHILGLNQCAANPQRGGNDLLPLHGRQQLVDAVAHLLQKGSVG